jgi:hypothetical protein
MGKEKPPMKMTPGMLRDVANRQPSNIQVNYIETNHDRHNVPPRPNSKNFSSRGSEEKQREIANHASPN